MNSARALFKFEFCLQMVLVVLRAWEPLGRVRWDGRGNAVTCWVLHRERAVALARPIFVSQKKEKTHSLCNYARRLMNTALRLVSAR